MLKHIKSSVRDTFIYSIGTFATKLTGFVLVPLYTNKAYLSETDYGILNLLEANFQLIISTISLGISYAFERWYWDSEFIHRQKSLFFTILISTMLLALGLSALAFPLSTPVSNWLLGHVRYSDVLILMVITASLEIVAQTPTSLIRLREKAAFYTSANLLKLITSLSLTVVFIVYFDLGLLGIYYAQLVGLLVYFITLLPFIIKNLAPTFEGKELINMISFRLPYLLPTLSLSIFSFNDRFVITKLIGVIDAGIYSLGAKMANTIKVFLITAIWLAITPMIYKMMNDPYNKRFYSKLMTYLGFSVMIVVMFFSFFSQEIISLFASDPIYEPAAAVIPIVALGIFFGLLKDVSMIGLNISKKTGLVATVTFLLTFLNFSLNYLLVPFIGMSGAAISGLITQMLFFLIIHYAAQKYYPIPYELPKIGLMIVAACLLYTVALSFDLYINHWLAICLKLLLIILFPIILFYLNFYEPVEIERLKGFWKKWKDPKNWKTNISSIKF
jgi:O-antigen/teichoic acid export membrane protein